MSPNFLRIHENFSGAANLKANLKTRNPKLPHFFASHQNSQNHFDEDVRYQDELQQNGSRKRYSIKLKNFKYPNDVYSPSQAAAVQIYSSKQSLAFEPTKRRNLPTSKESLFDQVNSLPHTLVTHSNQAPPILPLVNKLEP